MTTRLLACFALVLTTACASTEADGKNGDAVPVKVSISSVQMIQDCPNQDEPMQAQQERAASAAPAAMQPPRGAAGDVAPGAPAEGFSGHFEQPCTQSTMQLQLKSEGSETAAIAIQAVRLLSPEGKEVATLAARRPSAWADAGYQPWDERITPLAEVKASYKLAVPDWYDVEKKLGSTDSSVGKMFILEVDVSVDGRRQTIRSPAFPREEAHVVVT